MDVSAASSSTHAGSSHESSENTGTGPGSDKTLPQDVSTDKIRDLLQAKNDTSRFVGLALLKSLLDNSPETREEESVVLQLWSAIPAKFLDRLIKTGAGANASKKPNDAKEMLDLAVYIIHAFTLILPEPAKDSKLTERIPTLVAATLQSSEATTKLILQVLQALVNSPEGSKAFLAVEDVSPLTEIAPKHAEVLEVFSLAWLNSMALPGSKAVFRAKVDQTIQQLVSSFKGTDGVTLLTFLGRFLNSADPAIIPSQPKWLAPLISFIPSLVTSRPTADSRYAYTTLAAALLQAYPTQAPSLLFSSPIKSEKPFAYLFINLLLIDLRSSFPSLLEQLNKPEYAKTARRLASAFDTIASFIGFLVQAVEDESPTSMAALPPPDLLLKLRKAIAESMSVTIEFLRDRWDAAVAGAMGLHPDARAGTTVTSMGSRRTLAWDSMKSPPEEDPLILSAVRTLALWLREDDNDMLRRETTGLCDMLMDLYRSSSSEKLDFRSAILVALEGITTLDEGVEALLRERGWEILTSDLVATLQQSSTVSNENEAARGIEIVRILLPIVEGERTGSREDWMALATSVAAWDCPEVDQPAVVREFQVAVLQLVTALFVNAQPGMRRRYDYTARAIRGIRAQLEGRIGTSGRLWEALQEVSIPMDEMDPDP